MNQADKHHHWQHHIDSWHSSGLSQRAYCSEHHLSLTSFGYWRKSLAATAAVPAGGSQLIRLTPPAPAARIHIRLSQCVELDLPAVALGEVLPTLFKALEVRS